MYPKWKEEITPPPQKIKQQNGNNQICIFKSYLNCCIYSELVEYDAAVRRKRLDCKHWNVDRPLNTIILNEKREDTMHSVAK